MLRKRSSLATSGVTTSHANCSCWRRNKRCFLCLAFVRKGHKVDLFEAQKLMCQTSSNSSKLLHGGIRYLEQGHFGLVREALSDRAWWLNAAPNITRSIEIAMPVYKSSKRGASHYLQAPFYTACWPVSCRLVSLGYLGERIFDCL